VVRLGEQQPRRLALVQAVHGAAIPSLVVGTAPACLHARTDVLFVLFLVTIAYKVGLRQN